MTDHPDPSKILADIDQASETVWLTEKSDRGPAEVLGIFSTPERARDVCQESANEYFGAANTPALNWLGDDGHCSASYHHPGSGWNLFQITRFELDKVALQ